MYHIGMEKKNILQPLQKKVTVLVHILKLKSGDEHPNSSN